MRTIAVILLVTWHCTFCTMFVWGVVEPGQDVLPYRFVSRFLINDAVMPLFTFISGYLFYALYFEQAKYREFRSFLLAKTKRLLIPFLIFSPIIILTTFNTRMNFDDIAWGEGCHMWYCPMLFWCFILAWGLLKINSKAIFIIVSLLSTFLCFAYPNFWFLPFRLPLGIDNGFYYFSYFALGGANYYYKSDIYSIISKYKGMIIGFYCLLWVINCLDIYILSRISSSLQCYIFPVILWMLVFYMIDISVLNSNKYITKIGECSFGIYVFHHWIAWNIVWHPLVRGFLQENYIWFSILLMPLVFIMSLWLTDMLLKTRLGKFLFA